MKKIVRLSESDLIRVVKRIVNEAVSAPEPMANKQGVIFGLFHFQEGMTRPDSYKGEVLSKQEYDRLVNELAEYLRMSGTVQTLENMFNKTTGTPKLPKFITIRVGTSHTGTPEANTMVAEGRLNFLKGIVFNAFKKLNISSQYITSIITTDSNFSYNTSHLSRMYDPKKVKADYGEQYGDIYVYPLKMVGLDRDSILQTQKRLTSAAGLFNNLLFDTVDEKQIHSAIYKLKSPSDVQEIDEMMYASSEYGSLENFLNMQLKKYPRLLASCANALRSIAINFGLPSDTVRMIGNNISIGDAFKR